MFSRSEQEKWVKIQMQPGLEGKRENTILHTQAKRKNALELCVSRVPTPHPRTPWSRPLIT